MLPRTILCGRVALGTCGGDPHPLRVSGLFCRARSVSLESLAVRTLLDGNDRPSVLFDRTGWLVSQKVLLPGVSVLERFVSRLRGRVEERLWHPLISRLTPQRRRHSPSGARQEASAISATCSPSMSPPTSRSGSNVSRFSPSSTSRSKRLTCRGPGRPTRQRGPLPEHSVKGEALVLTTTVVGLRDRALEASPS
jgi:hypothetical protein